MSRLEQWWNERLRELEKLENTSDDAAWSVDLAFHRHTDAEFAQRAREAARQCPRCSSCRHHPNAHGRSGCIVIVDGKINGKKCGCAALKAAA